MTRELTPEALEQLLADHGAELHPAIQRRLSAKVTTLEAARDFVLGCLNDPSVFRYMRNEHGDRERPFRFSLDRLALVRMGASL